MTAVELPSLDLLRAMTDRHVVAQLAQEGQLTRAEIASRTGLSKPTVSESVRRLSGAGVVREAGSQSGGRGRSGTYVSLDEAAGVAVAVAAGTGEVTLEVLDVHGTVLARHTECLSNPATATDLAAGLARVVSAGLEVAPGPVRATAVSIANPVDRSGRVVTLPDSPFLVSDFDVRAEMSRLLPGALVIDNDVNWAARVERAEGLSDFVYCHLGAGIGAGLVVGGRIVTGHRGLAGELAHVLTTGPRGRAMRLVECFGAAGLLVPGTSSIDVEAMRDLMAGRRGTAGRRREMVAALAGVLAGVAALVNPQVLVIGGSWGREEGFVARLRAAVDLAAVVPVDVTVASAGPDAPLAGARRRALADLRDLLVASVG